MLIITQLSYYEHYKLWLQKMDIFDPFAELGGAQVIKYMYVYIYVI